MSPTQKRLKKWTDKITEKILEIIFGENFQGFADMKEYENGTIEYDEKR